MLIEKIDLPVQHYQRYLEFSDPQTIAELFTLCRDLQNVRFIHMNSTSIGGGVAEILQSLVPLMKCMGLQADWYVISPPIEFFEITKKLHNFLQGKSGTLSPTEQSYYEDCLKQVDEELMTSTIQGDAWFLHDPQLLPLGQHLSERQSGFLCWLCHIDLSAPNMSVLNRLQPMTSYYDALTFSRSSYVPTNWDIAKIHIFPPAIDPSTQKNTPLAIEDARALVTEAGVDPNRPLICQVSRFDPWKDPWGVIDVFRSVKKKIPDLQLAMLGLAQASDDPEFAEILTSVSDHAAEDPDIHLIWDPSPWEGRIDRLVNAFQVWSNVIIQKSLREGFGLTVTEAMWKGSPVVGGNVGGIKDQITDGLNGYLVDSIKQCSERVVALMNDNSLRERIGIKARESVQGKYLLPRLLRDQLLVAQQSLAQKG